MTKIKEIISKVWTKTESDEHIYDIFVSDIEAMMVEYAEWYAIEFAKNLCRNIADSTKHNTVSIELDCLERATSFTKLPEHN